MKEVYSVFQGRSRRSGAGTLCPLGKGELVLVASNLSCLCSRIDSNVDGDASIP